jgi:hypothetical protein
MYERYIFSSLTRIAPLCELPITVKALPRQQWATGDYVACEVNLHPLGFRHIELPTGRMMEVMRGDLVVGALGKRRATLEATGTWEKVGDDGIMHALTSAGLFGVRTSKAPLASTLIHLKYRGHVLFDKKKATMRQFVSEIPYRPFTTPVVLIVGSSMSAGKTTSARIIVRQLKEMGLKVLGAKLAGAGRYRDIQSMADAGADHVYDFVDVGLPSTICSTDEYQASLRDLLSLMAGAEADVAVIEIGSSPLEPYNGDLAIKSIKANIQCTALCASDPYAVYGVMNAFKMYPSFVTGPATNTRAGIELIEKLCGIHALNLLNPDSQEALCGILQQELEKFLKTTV